MYRITTLLFSLLFSALSFAAPQVWQVQKGDLSFTIMGSVHAGKPEFYPLPEVMVSRFESADGLILEADIINDKSISIPKGKSSASYLTDAQKETLEQIAVETGTPSNVLLNLPPWQAAMALQLYQINQLELQQLLGIDLYFLSRSQKHSVPVIPLETVQQQVDLLANADKDGLELLTDTLDYWELSKEFMPCLIDAWQYGDGAKMEEMVTVMSGAGDFERQLIDERNHNWLEALTDRSRFDKGSYVMVVGALHLYGKEGVLTLLEKAGFDVKLLTQGEQVDCKIPAIP
ncbi:TraB/GumN family protein [Grimontia marina]|uniref:TraB family protein n=1 Tax=Grimontia marina TaxID=646534 RepID=A0A128FE78_9GAMM|nr:TraB/GumN family protein [Grimontia marina]CZF84624.1 TraB family protein [Grimontia marina]